MYHLFGGTECYYASGGANDFIKTFSDLEAARLFVERLKCFEFDDSDKEYPEELDWWHVTDENMKIVAQSRATPHMAECGLGVLNK